MLRLSWKALWHLAALYPAFLFSTTLVDGQPCNSDAPDNCTFASGLSSCRWPFDSSGWVNERSSAVFGVSGSSEVNVTSRTACPTGQETHCLQIRYLFELNNTSIRVLFIRVRDESRELAAWNGAGAGVGVWHSASIPIQSKDNFTITVEANKFTGDFGMIFIKSIHYIKAPCSHLPTSTEQSSVTNTQEERTTTIGSHVSGDASSTVTSPAATRTQEETTIPIGSHVSTDASNNAGVVVGVVFAVIVIAVAVVIIILYRRKRLHLWKTCFRNKTKKNAAVTGISQNGERTVDRDDRRTFNSVNATPTVSGYENHPFPFSGPQSAVSYYNVIHSANGARAGDSAAPQYSNMHGSQSADYSKVPNDSTFADIDPYEIKAENGILASAATINTNPNTHAKGTTRQYQNYPVPACNRDKSQPTSDYSLARAEGGETNGVYDYPEEDPRNPREGEETAMYQYAKDPDVDGEGHADATGVYHILEHDSPKSQPVSIYNVPKGGKVGQQHTPTANVSNGQTGNYNTLDFAGKSSGQKNDRDDSGGVYNHLNAESDDPYNEVDREKRAEVIDGEYSHIPSKATLC